MSKNVLIIEDNKAQAMHIAALARSVDEKIDIKFAENCGDAYKILMENTIDVFLVDIILEPQHRTDTSGLRLAKNIRSIEKYMFTPLIFITTLYDPEMYAYRDLNCLGYLEKPFDPNEAKRLIRLALNYSSKKESDGFLYFREDGVLYPIRISNIVYIQNNNHVLNIYLSNNDIFKIKYRTCKQFIDEANCDSLFQCNRSSIVNLNYVKSIDLTNRYVELYNNIHLTIGRAYLNDMRKVRVL